MKKVSRWLWVAVVLSIVTLLWAIYLLRKPLPSPISTSVLPPQAFRPTGPPDRPHIVITPDHQLARVQHKDAAGLSPLEYVQTPAGRVTIQRTFGKDGELLKQEAFLDGKPVAVPK